MRKKLKQGFYVGTDDAARWLRENDPKCFSRKKKRRLQSEAAKRWNLVKLICP